MAAFPPRVRREVRFPQMARLEDLTPGAKAAGLIPGRTATIRQVDWHGTNALTAIYENDDGELKSELLYRDDESRLSIETPGAFWSFDADGDLFRLVSEARRISLAYLFDP